MIDEEVITLYAAFIHTISFNDKYFSFLGEYSTNAEAEQAVIKELKFQRAINKRDSHQFCGKVEKRYCINGAIK